MPNYVVYLSIARERFCVVNTQRFLEGRKYFQVPDALSVEEIVIKINEIRLEAESNGLVLDSIPSLAEHINRNSTNNGFGRVVVKTGALEKEVKEPDFCEKMTREERMKNRHRYMVERGKFRGRRRFY